MLPLFPGKRKIWRRSSEILSERVAQSPIGVKKKIPFVPFFSIIISPIIAPTSSDISDQIFAKAEQGHHVLWSHLKDELEIGVAEMAL